MAPAGRRLIGIRAALVAIGAAILLAALLLDRLGLGQPGGFGLGQLLLATLGVLLLLAGALGARFTSVYRATAILLLNTLLVLGLVELTAIAVARLGLVPSASRLLLARHLRQPYYAGEEWSENYWREAVAAEAYRYEPYVGWRHAPFEGRTINIDERGLRSTPGSTCVPGAFTLFAFGGSSMWGWGSPDWGTIPAYLQGGLDRRLDRPVCVVNFGEDAWVSTQGLIALERQLQRGEVPDAVVFFDGVNEVFAAFQTGLPAAHLELSRIAARFEERQHPLLDWLGGLRTVSLARSLRAGPDSRRLQLAGRPRGAEPRVDQLAGGLVAGYLENHRLAQVLGREYGFRSLFFWQPNLAIDGKRLTAEEQELRAALEEQLVRLTRGAYAEVARAAPGREGLWYVADLFDDVDEQLWIDELGHVTPAGNELVARRMLAEIGGD